METNGFCPGLCLLLGKWFKATYWVPFSPLWEFTRTGCTTVGGREEKENVRDLDKRGENPPYQEVGAGVGGGSSLLFSAPKNKESHQDIILPLCLLFHLNCALLWKAEFCLLELVFHKSPSCTVRTKKLWVSNSWYYTNWDQRWLYNNRKRQSGRQGGPYK